MDNDASNAAVLVASEAHTITLALEGLLGVVFTIATLTDEALDAGEVRRDDSYEYNYESGNVTLLFFIPFSLNHQNVNQIVWNVVGSWPFFVWIWSIQHG